MYYSNYSWFLIINSRVLHRSSTASDDIEVLLQCAAAKRPYFSVKMHVTQFHAHSVPTVNCHRRVVTHILVRVCQAPRRGLRQRHGQHKLSAVTRCEHFSVAPDSKPYTLRTPLFNTNVPTTYDRSGRHSSSGDYWLTYIRRCKAMPTTAC